MTSDGHAYSRFERALGTGNPHLVITAALELPRLSLADSLRVVLAFARGQAEQTERAAVRWAARYLAEVRPAPSPQEAHIVLSAVCALGGSSADAGYEALRSLATSRRLHDLCRVLDDWQPSD